MQNPRATIPMLLAMLPAMILFPIGCAVDKGGTEADGSGGVLRAGHYLIEQNMDGELGTQNYFVVLPDSAWESVIYQISYGNKVCGVRRTRGLYSAGDSSIALFALESADGPDECPLSQAGFDNVSWEALPVGEGEVMDIRNVAAGSFEARGAFAGPSWMKFHRMSDPHGYYD